MSYNALIRPLKNGNEYNSLFPTPKEKKVRLAKGDTHTSIELIIKWALENNHEVKLVAPKLQKGSLSETCYAIHDFLYNHFQYEADGEAQLLRSPAYAWKHRYEGIDCKSYSIIASCILLQLGVVHYIRKIKQSAFAPESFTHVYVIVPVDQTSGSLTNGYYTIDGTLKDTQEPHYIDKKDFFMDKLQHYGLNGVSNFDFNTVKKYLNTPISCWGGSALSASQVDLILPHIGGFFENLLIKINNDVKNLNLLSLQKNVTEFEGVLFTAIAGYEKKKSKGWNSCTTKNIGAIQHVLNFYKDVAWVGLSAWLNKYFNSSKIGSKEFRNDNNFEGVDPHFWFSYTSPNITYSADIRNYQLKEGVSTIPAFEFTPYVEEVASGTTSFDPVKFLQGLSTVLVSFQGNNNNGNPTDTEVIDENGNIIYQNENKPKNNNAGMGLVFGSLALIGLAIWGFSKMKDKGNSKTKN